MLSPNQINSLAAAFASNFPFDSALEGYSWPKGATLHSAWSARNVLQSSFTSQQPLDYATNVHRWGFGGANIPPRILAHPAFLPSLTGLLHTWNGLRTPWLNSAGYPERTTGMVHLITLLGIPGLGIARISKWICFINQNDFAIYDSRVAYALRDLLIDGERVFPFVGSRPAPAGDPARVNGDALLGNPERVATTYVNFLLLMRETAARLNAVQPPLSVEVSRTVGPKWTPGLVEMALFHSGAERTRSVDIARVNGAINCSWP